VSNETARRADAGSEQSVRAMCGDVGQMSSRANSHRAGYRYPGSVAGVVT